MTLLILTVPILILFAAFFSAAETALIAASRAKLHKLKSEGEKRAELVRVLREEKQDHLIGAIMIANNVLTIAATSIATYITIKFWGESKVAYATLFMATVIVLFSELLPKSYALRNSLRVSMFAAPIMNIVIKVLTPLTWAIQHIVKILLTPFSKVDEDLVEGAEALRGAISLHHHEGAVVKDDRDMLTSILDLSNVEVREIMVHRKEVVMYNMDVPTSELIPEILASAHSRVPIWKDEPENIIGILHVKDLLREIHNHNNSYEALDMIKLLRDPWFIPENTSLKEQLRNFREKQAHFAIIVDEYGAFLGILTLEDILEEIVGQIEDEHDVANRKIKALQDGSFIVDGSLNLRDFNRDLDWNLPDDKASTIAGLLIHEAQLIPEVNQVFQFYNVRFEVLKKTRNQINSVKVKKVDA